MEVHNHGIMFFRDFVLQVYSREILIISEEKTYHHIPSCLPCCVLLQPYNLLVVQRTLFNECIILQRGYTYLVIPSSFYCLFQQLLLFICFASSNQHSLTPHTSSTTILHLQLLPSLYTSEVYTISHPSIHHYMNSPPIPAAYAMGLTFGCDTASYWVNLGSQLSLKWMNAPLFPIESQ